MTRTTIALEDALLSSLRLRAAREGRSLTAVVNDVLRTGLQVEPESRGDRPVNWRTFRCGQALVDISDRDALYSVMDGP